MTTLFWCLLGFAVWALVLTFMLLVVRSAQVLSGKKKSNEFPSGLQHGTDAEWRLNRAQINTLEYLPLFGALVCVGSLAGLSHSGFETASVAVLVGRVGQSTTHLVSGSVMAVNVRVTFFSVQLVAWTAMALFLARAYA